MRKRIVMNVKFNKDGKVECAKSKDFCKQCPYRKVCEEIKFYYDPFDDLDFCRNNDYRKK